MSPEEENTFRALKDEPLLMTSFWCKFGIHRWTKYTDPVKVGLKYRYSSYYLILRQEKRCVHCNIPSYRTHLCLESLKT